MPKSSSLWCCYQLKVITLLLNIFLQNKSGTNGPRWAIYCTNKWNHISSPRGIHKMCRVCKAWQRLLAWKAEPAWQTMTFFNLWAFSSAPYSSRTTLRIFWATFKEIRVILWELVWAMRRSQDVISGSGPKPEGSFQIRCIKDRWKKIPKGWGMKYPVITPKWCKPFTKLLPPWVLLSCHCKLIWAMGGSLGSLEEDHPCPTNSGDAKSTNRLANQYLVAPLS